MLHLFRYDPRKDELTDLGSPIPSSGQVYGMASRSGKLYMCSYIRALLSVYAPSRPWSPGITPEHNPRLILAIGGHQHRPSDMVVGPDDAIYVSSGPAYGHEEVGRALSRFEPETEQVEVYLDADATELAADNRYVYASNGNEFFAWDPTSKRKAFSDRRDGAITALAADGKHVYIATGRGALDVFDPNSRSFAEPIKLPAGSASALLVGRDGLVYGVSGKRIFQFNPARRLLAVSTGAPVGLRQLVQDESGNLYSASGSHLWQFVPRDR
jgi:sugar lactone lactonase YvrE